MRYLDKKVLDFLNGMQKIGIQRITTAELVMEMALREEGIIFTFLMNATKKDEKYVVDKVYDCYFNNEVFAMEQIKKNDAMQLLDLLIKQFPEKKDKYIKMKVDILNNQNLEGNLAELSQIGIPVLIAQQLNDEGKIEKAFKGEMSANAVYCLYKAVETGIDETLVNLTEFEIQIIKNQSGNLVELLRSFGQDIEDLLIFNDLVEKELYQLERFEHLENKKELPAEKKESMKMKGFNIPSKMQKYCTCLNNDFVEGEPCEILGREEEVEELWNILLKREKRNAILVGEAGVGKTAIIEKITWEIVNKKCPKEFVNFKVILLQVNAIIAGTKYRGSAEENFSRVSKFLEENQDIILFIDEIHTIIGAGEVGDKGSLDFSNSLKPILAGKNSRVIGATTSMEYERDFSKDPAFKRRFGKVEVAEPKAEDIPRMIANKVNCLKKYHEVDISDEYVRKCISVARCFTMVNHDPDRTLDLIDKVMTKAKRLNKTEVDDECIAKVYEKNFQKLEKMDKETVKAVAYHEMGHYLIYRMNGNSAFAVSIVPTDEFLGAMFHNLEKEKKLSNREDLMGKIMVSLAGRIAEKMYTKTDDAGAASDLEMATKIAYDILTKYGMGKHIGQNRTYINQTSSRPYNSEQINLFNSELTSRINSEIDDIITEAYLKTKSILEENEELLEALVEAILEKKILNEEELDRICENFQNKKAQ